MTRQLLERLYKEPELYTAVRIIGYEGIPVDAFWEAAKKTGLDAGKLRAATYDVTQFVARDGPKQAFVLRDDVKRYAWQLLGPPPDHPDYKADRQKKLLEELAPEPKEAAEESKLKKARAQKGRTR